MDRIKEVLDDVEKLKESILSTNSIDQAKIFGLAIASKVKTLQWLYEQKMESDSFNCLPMDY